jgi:hypothetical protein
MEKPDGILILITCPEPECAGRAQQTAQFSRAELKRMLDDGEDVGVIGAICGHSWSLSEPDKEKIHKAIKAGEL